LGVPALADLIVTSNKPNCNGIDKYIDFKVYDGTNSKIEVDDEDALLPDA
jgi:hypothetical protein